jgi:hypothetical protein
MFNYDIRTVHVQFGSGTAKHGSGMIFVDVTYPSAYLQINRTKINVPNINVLQINGSLHQQKLVEV